MHLELDKFYKLFVTHGFKYTTDSRKIERGALFFALKGANFNGNSYALQAIKDGASYAVVDEAMGHDIKLIKVDDVLRFMQNVANMHRSAFSIPVIAVGGSNGKTTSKNLMHAVLAKKFKTHVTAGNFNNHIGVPMTLLDMPQDTEMAIIELGTNNPGEIRELCRIVEPTHGIITNIGKEHLEGFGTLEAVAKEESELYHYLHSHKGHAFVNADDEGLSRMSRSLASKTNFSAKDIQIDHLVPFIKGEYKGEALHSELMGDYNLENILAALTIGEFFGVPVSDCVQAVNAYKADNNRSELRYKGSNVIWLDAYNANPSSMQKAISNFSKLPQTKKVLILGDMFELGDHSKQEHSELLKWIAENKELEVYLLGKAFQEAAKTSAYTAYPDMDTLVDALKAKGYRQTAFLIKGSRGMQMEKALAGIPDN